MNVSPPYWKNKTPVLLSNRKRVMLALIFSTVSSDPFAVPFSAKIYIIRVVLNFIFTLTAWYILRELVKFLRQKYATPQEQLKRFYIQFALTILFIVLYSLLLESTIGFFVTGNGFQWQNYWGKVKFLCLAVFGISSIFEIIYSYTRWGHAYKEAELLRGENAIAQLETLKSQVNPHFLFNSLNTLSSIIAEKPAVAETFVDKLADFYRYILNTQHQNLVSIHTELEFVKSYIFMLSIRYENALHVVVEDQKSETEMYLPPLVLQMLVENAIKHNTISQSKPLTITISIDAGKAIVHNKIQKKMTMEPSTGLGLANIKKRIELLSSESIKVVHTKETFTVVIPLIHVDKNESINR
ncbi:MAG TPA: histidine kinase [Cytophaga sp.]|jgi:two-component system LytT family sensor kinase|nr:histidine kinase [Cytophaga sp.]